MKRLLFNCAILLTPCLSIAQIAPLQKTVATNAAAQKTTSPDRYKLRFFIQEETTGDPGKAPTGKTSIDSLKQVLFKNLRAYGFKDADFKLIKITSAPSLNYSPHAQITLNGAIYDLAGMPPDLALKIVDDLRFGGLKGVLAKGLFPPLTLPERDSLYKAALSEARKTAETLAKESGKSVGGVIGISSYNSNVSVVPEYDPEDIYSLSKFEMPISASRILTITVNVTYELK